MAGTQQCPAARDLSLVRGAAAFPTQEERDEGGIARAAAAGGCETPHRAAQGEAGLVKPMFDPSWDT